MREQVITPRAGRGAAGAKGRKVAASQRPASRRAGAAKGAHAEGFPWKKALVFLPLALKLVLAVTFGVLAFVGYRTAASASFFNVKEVDVQGASRASRDEIKQAVMRKAAAGVWQADLEAISREVREVPWVRSAVVARVLPDGLRVRVTERQPRVIARTSYGRLVWVDDEGVALGTATAGDNDFFVRGLEEGRTSEALRQNRERVAVALELKADWERAGLASRVSEINLYDLRDVRVQLDGPDARTEVRLGREDYATRFRNALAKLDERRRTHGDCVSYVDMTVSKNNRAILAPVPCSRTLTQDAATGGEGATAAPATAPAAGDGRAAAQSESAAPTRAAKREGKRARPKQQEQGRGNAARQPDVAVRPRRVG